MRGCKPAAPPTSPAVQRPSLRPPSQPPIHPPTDHHAPPAPAAGVTVDALLFGVLWLAWLTSRQYNRVLQRLSRRERIRITWGLRGEPRITVVKAAASTGDD